MKKELIKIREIYIENIKKELLGPGSEYITSDIEHEIITSQPSSRYSIGVLYPQGEKFNSDNDELQTEADDANPDDNSDNQTETQDEDEKNSSNKSADNDHTEENLDEEIGMALQNMPSSMGITFFAKGNTDKVNCIVSFATYRKAALSDCKVNFCPDDKDNYELPLHVQQYLYFDKENSMLHLTQKITSKKVTEIKETMLHNGIDDPFIINQLYAFAAQCNQGFVRVPHSVDVSVNFSDNDYAESPIAEEECEISSKITACRRKMEAGRYSVTIMFVNNETTKDKKCLFQSVIKVNTDANDFEFLDYSGVTDIDKLDDEEKSLELLYRNKKVYATGLGTSATWSVADGLGYIKTEYFPQVEVPSMEFQLPENADIDKNVLSMKYLSDLNNYNKEDKTALLTLFVNLYNSWIEAQKDNASRLDDKFKGIALKNISECEKSCKRMFAGIKTLKENDNAWSAFELANRAMFMQRAHIQFQKKTSSVDRYDGDEEICDFLDSVNYYTVDEIIDDYYAWRPFQLAFILMSINSICFDDCEDRDIVDLIWFPTGGGKTEAYLGLTAFTIFYRRLAYPDSSDGTAIIMRYTLRLLTAQQFNRASTLICACEYIRQDSFARKPKYKSYSLGKDSKITIGLWIGSEHTPNKNSDADENLRKLKDSDKYNLNYNKENNNKFQVLKCPWCGTKMVKDIKDGRLIGDWGYKISKGRFVEFCPQEDCLFNGSLPIQIVDEELYKNPPTLLFATVDKFAMMPWNNDIGAFFGIGTNNRTPELIIQDELHLISGPLGTMVGIYETAIDYLCAHKGTKSKIIASTATIRRAKEQCAALYNRAVAQFPAHGINAEDSFFAREATINHNEGKYGRNYVGLMPSGKTKATMELRSIAALLQEIYQMDISDEEKDKFWTTTVYFNSIKELGKCTTLVEDDVKDAIRRIGIRKKTDYRKIGNPDELTSRVSTSDLNTTLDKLEHTVYSKENVKNRIFASNVLLATNMISVGIDISRLNAMLMVGQPKLTSEYIQASSRVGREFPGVAFVLYDGSKSRDRSHYEQFKPYHESFYKFVEPTGATPFSEPARDRALHAVVITILRYLNPELSDEKGAGKFDSEQYSSQIDEIKKYIVERNKSINLKIDPNLTDNSDQIEVEIDRIIEKWDDLLSRVEADNFFYGGKFLRRHPNEEEGRLLKSFNSDDKDDDVFNTMSSMRSVDSELRGNVLTWEN